MNRELKKSIKEDEFVTTLEKLAIWATNRRDELRIAVGLVVVLGVAGAAFLYFQGERAREADEGAASGFAA